MSTHHYHNVDDLLEWYPTQQLMFDHAQKVGNNVYLATDKANSNTKNAKKYASFKDHNTLANLILSHPTHDCTLYELIREEKKSLFYLDSDLVSPLPDPGYGILRRIITAASTYLTTKYGRDPGFVILNGSRQSKTGYKNSYHIVATNIAYACNTSTLADDVAAIANELPEGDLDMSVYSRNRLMRVPGAHKGNDVTKTKLCRLECVNGAYVMLPFNSTADILKYFVTRVPDHLKDDIIPNRAPTAMVKQSRKRKSMTHAEADPSDLNSETQRKTQLPLEVLTHLSDLLSSTHGFESHSVAGEMIPYGEGNGCIIPLRLKNGIESCKCPLHLDGSVTHMSNNQKLHLWNNGHIVQIVARCFGTDCQKQNRRRPFIHPLPIELWHQIVGSPEIESLSDDNCYDMDASESPQRKYHRRTVELVIESGQDCDDVEMAGQGRDNVPEPVSKKDAKKAESEAKKAAKKAMEQEDIITKRKARKLATKIRNTEKDAATEERDKELVRRAKAEMVDYKSTSSFTHPHTYNTAR